MSELRRAPRARGRPTGSPGRQLLRALSAVLLALGALLFLATAWWLGPLPLAEADLQRSGKLLLAAVVGLGLRSLRRKSFFREGIDLDQAFSFEILLQCLHALSPLLPRRAFEAEFLTRELAGGRPVIESWLRARALGVGVVSLVAIAFALQLHGHGMPAAAVLLVALITLGSRLRPGKRAGAILLVIGTGAVAWAVEGALFAWAVEPLVPAPRAWLAYLAFTGLFELVPVPLALGIAELPALVLGDASVFVVLALFHLARLLPLAVLGVLYFPRHKFSLGDLFDPNLIAALRRTQRPVEGWREAEAAEPNTTELSIVIPAYNEERRLPPYLEWILAHLAAGDRRVEILVVDDGSTDDTAGIVEGFAARHQVVRLLRQGANQGKGAAVRRGVLESEGRHVLFTDADGATPIEELDRLLLPDASGAEIRIGSRRAVAADVHRERRGPRALMGLAFYKMVNLLAVPGIRDSQCGFKLFRRDAADAIFGRVREKGWAFDVEVLYLAQLLGFRIEEVAVSWREIAGSKMSPIRDAARMFLAILRIRRRHAGFVANSAARDAAEG